MLKKATNGLLDLRITSGAAAMSAVWFVGCDVAWPIPLKKSGNRAK
jgi:hypothetical protein